MKLFKKSIALLAIISIIMISSVTAFAAFSTITTSQTATEVKAGDTVAIEATFDTLENAKGFEIEFIFDNTAFHLDTANDEGYNFGSSKKPSYWPNYIIDDLKEEKLAGDEGYCPFFGGVWDTFNYNATETKVKFLGTDTSGTVISAADEAEDMYPYRTLGVVFTANDDIAPGSYEFTINAIVSDATVGNISATKTVTVTVEGGEEVFEITKTATSLEATDTMKVKNETTGELEDKPATGDKVVAIFAKNVTGAELAAESYGIIFGGKRFPGMAKVPAGASWAVKLVGSAEQLPAGKYAYGIFAAGCDDVNAGNYTVE